MPSDVYSTSLRRCCGGWPNKGSTNVQILAVTSGTRMTKYLNHHLFAESIWKSQFSVPPRLYCNLRHRRPTVASIPPKRICGSPVFGWFAVWRDKVRAAFRCVTGRKSRAANSKHFTNSSVVEISRIFWVDWLVAMVCTGCRSHRCFGFYDSS